MTGARSIEDEGEVKSSRLVDDDLIAVLDCWAGGDAKDLDGVGWASGLLSWNRHLSRINTQLT
jgi:hypothetical protein